MSFGSPGAFPMVGVSTAYGTSPPYLKFHQFQGTYSEVTSTHIYEDGGASFVLYNDTAPIRFEITYAGLTEAQVAVLDAHRADAFGEVYGFSLTNPRTLATYSNVHYDSEFAEDHIKTWNNSRTIHLIKRPA